MTESPGGAARLVRSMPLLAEFPLCQVPPHSNDSVYPSLSWQPKAARRALMRLAAAAPWFRVRSLPSLLQCRRTSPGVASTSAVPSVSPVSAVQSCPLTSLNEGLLAVTLAR